MTSKKDLSERDICSKFISPALEKAGWDMQTQIREEVSFTNGRIYVKGNLTARGKRKRADYILYYKPNIPVAIIEAKDNKHSVRDGIQQGLDYARTLDIPTAYSSNGDAFYEHDRTSNEGNIEREIALDDFPSPQALWQRYKKYKGIATKEQERISTQGYFFDGSGKTPRYYQQIASNRTVEAIAKGQSRILLTMATGTGKTYTAFQIIHRLRKSGTKKRILFLADRNALIDQTRRGDFRHFRKDEITVVKHKQIDKAFKIYLALYQGLTDYNEDKDAYRQFSPKFFDLIVIDECHRGSAADDSAWHEILNYFNHATHIGLTATPKETKTISSSEYFGDPIYTYSLRQGIEDGFLAPYKVLRVSLNVDLEGWRPEFGKKDKQGRVVEDRLYNRKDFDKNLVIDERTQTVADKVTEFLKKTDRFDKTIIFCTDIDHAQRMRADIANANSDLTANNSKYVMQITGDNQEGKNELDNFINPEESYPVIATTSKLMTTGVDTQTCKLIVLDSNIASMTEFKQIIGRGTRINEEYNKRFFTIMDFRNVTDLFADPDFDGDPVRVKEIGEDEAMDFPEEEADTHGTVVDEDGEEIIFNETESPEIITGGDIISEPRAKYYVNGVNVAVLNERVQYMDSNGKLITANLRDYTRQKVRERFASLDDFLSKWNATERKQAIIDELTEQGVVFENFKEAISKEMDIFDLICHTAFDQPPLTRSERVNNVKKRDYFTQYSEQARKVLAALLDKYANEGIENIEDIKILTISPFDEIGTPVEIVKLFGGKVKYQQALAELEHEIYRVA